MALLERMTSMKQSGMSETQIINTLSEEGISPLEINEAISQLKIKSAISAEPEMQASIMEPPQPPQAPTENYPPQNFQQQYTQPVYQQQYQESYSQYPQEQQYASPEAGYQQGIDMETIRDISKQVVEEALQKMRDELSSLSKTKAELKFEVQGMENRLIKIESIIQELQSAIIRKMGEYGEAISGISEEMRATQDSFAKVINPLMDNRKISLNENSQSNQEIQKTPQSSQPRARKTQAQPKQSARTDGSGATFEDYFR
jgi:archaellum component FlaC